MNGHKVDAETLPFEKANVFDTVDPVWAKDHVQL